MNAIVMDPFRYEAVPLRGRERERVEDDPLAHARSHGSGTRPNATPPRIHSLTLVATPGESNLKRSVFHSLTLAATAIGAKRASLLGEGQRP